MFKLKDQQQTLGAVIQDSFGLLRCTWASNIIVVLAGIVAAIIIMIIFGFASYRSLIQIFVQHKAELEAGQNPLLLIFTSPGTIPSVVLFLLGLVFCIWTFKITNAILVRASSNVATTGHAKLGNAFSVGFKYFWVYLLQFLLLLGISIALWVVQWLVSMADIFFLDVVVAIIAQLVIYYFSVKLVLVDAAAVIDDCGIQGFSRSWCVTKGNWWRTVGSLFFSSAFYAMALYFIGLGIFWLVFSPGLHPVFSTVTGALTPLWFTVLFAIAGVVTLLALVFTVPSMFAGNQTVLYNDLKLRCKKECSSAKSSTTQEESEA